MPASYSFKENILIFTDSGSSPTDEIIHVFTAALSDSDFVAGMNLLVDISKRKTAKTVKEVVRITDFLGKHRKRLGSRCAIVAPRPLPPGFTGVIRSQAEFHSLQVEVFSNIREAKKWIRK
jgi:hypothetical protein